MESNVVLYNDIKFMSDVTFNHNSIELKKHKFSINESINNNSIENYEQVDLCNFEFEEKISKNDKWDYTAAILSGIISAGIDIFYVKEFSLQGAAKWGKEEISNFVLSFAKINGYKGEHLNDAIGVLERKFKLPSDKLTPEFGNGLQHHLRDFVHHPTPIGLFFSILSQFTHKGFGTDTNGNFIIRDIPLDAFEAKTFEEKIYHGVIVWLFHLISDMAGSSSSTMGGTGIPGFLLSTLKEISALPIVKEIKVKYENNDIELSKFISKLFNGTYFKGNTKEENIRFDLRTEIGILKELSRQTIPVIINECIVRSFFTMKRFYTEVKNKEINKFHDLTRIDYLNVLPYRNESLNRMLTIATGTFSMIDSGHAFVYAAIKNKSMSPELLKDFLVRVNIVGIGRFTLACKVELDSFSTKQAIKSSMKSNVIPELKEMTLDRNKTKILYSLELLKCNLDMESTKNKINKDIKSKWIESWKATILQSLKESDDFFIVDKEELTHFINDELNYTDDDSWMDIVSLELSVFIPYYPLNSEDDPKYVKLKFNLKSFDEILSSMQDYESSKDIQDIYKLYKKNHDLISGKTTKQVIGTAGAAVATLVTGGLAFYFAPQIATLLVGGSLVGLHGAALTSASLAMLGGGALAYGGLGMAGGTAVIAGGGAIIGLTAGGLANTATALLFSNSDYTLKECSKLLTITKYTILGEYNDINAATKLSTQLKNIVLSLEKDCDNLPDEIDNKKQIIKGNNKSKKYLNKCISEIEKEINRIKKRIPKVKDEFDAIRIYKQFTNSDIVYGCIEYKNFYLFTPNPIIGGAQPIVVFKENGKVIYMHFSKMRRYDKEIIKEIYFDIK